MGSSFSAASLVFLPAAAWTGIVAPDLLLLSRPGSGGLDFCKLFQKVKAHCLAGQLHCEDLLAEVLNIHFAGLEGLSDVRTKRERLEAFLRRRHLHHLIRCIATVAGHPRRIAEFAAKFNKSIHVSVRPEADVPFIEVIQNAFHAARNRPDAVEKIVKGVFQFIAAQTKPLLHEAAERSLFRCVLAVEGIIIFQQMLFVRHIVRLFLLAALRLYEKVNGLPNQGNVNDLAVKGLCVLNIRVKLIPLSK